MEEINKKLTNLKDRLDNLNKPLKKTEDKGKLKEVLKKQKKKTSLEKVVEQQEQINAELTTNEVSGKDIIEGISAIFMPRGR